MISSDTIVWYCFIVSIYSKLMKYVLRCLSIDESFYTKLIVLSLFNWFQNILLTNPHWKDDLEWVWLFDFCRF